MGGSNGNIARPLVTLQALGSKETETFTNSGSVSDSGKSRDFTQDADFVPPLYNIWTFAKKNNAVSHFGNSEQRIVAQNHTERL